MRSRMTNTTKAVTPPNVTRNATRSVANINQEPADLVQTMNAEQRQALMEQLKLAQQQDVAPLEQRKQELEAELAEVNKQIQAIKPFNDSLAVFRAVRKAVKDGQKSLEDIAQAAGYDTATVEAVLTKHTAGKDGNSPLFTLKNGEYTLTPKVKKARS